MVNNLFTYGMPGVYDFEGESFDVFKSKLYGNPSLQGWHIHDK